MTVTANNLANVNTNGFKKSRAVFKDLLYQNVTPGRWLDLGHHQLPVGVAAGHRCAVWSQPRRVYTQGNLDARPAIPSTSPSTVRASSRCCMPDGTLAYTRDGSFQLNAQGQLVNASGYPVQPAITIPQGAQSVTIAPTGRSAC